MARARQLHLASTSSPPLLLPLLLLLLLQQQAGTAAAAQDHAASRAHWVHFITRRQVDRQPEFLAASASPPTSQQQQAAAGAPTLRTARLRGLAMLLPGGGGSGGGGGGGGMPAPLQRRSLQQGGPAAEARQIGPFGDVKTGEALPLQGRPGPGDPSGRERVEGAGIYGKQLQILLDFTNRVAASE
jgi:hypothetical protein